MYICISLYIYIYTHRWRESERERESAPRSTARPSGRRRGAAPRLRRESIVLISGVQGCGV